MSVVDGNAIFHCKDCSAPIVIDDTSERTVDEHSEPTTREVDTESQTERIDRNTIPGFQSIDSFSDVDGFTLLGESNTPKLSHQFKVYANLRDIVSGTLNVNHPLCNECTDTMMDIMEEQIQQAEEDYTHYSNYLKEFSAEEPVDMDALDKKIDDLSREEEKLMCELKNSKESEKALNCEIKEAKKEEERLIEEEQRHWKDYNKYQREYIIIKDKQESIERQIAHSTSRLAKMRKTDIFNAIFHIWHDGQFGTINGLRLGRLPLVPVNWTEINAAWGQVTLLLFSLARYMNIKFKKYCLVPYGNHSYVEVLGEKKTLPLYVQGGIRFVWNTKFDLAMVAFLDCLQQFKEEVEKGDSGFRLPYRMGKDKIEDSATGNAYSIRIQLNSEEGWTKALKFMLTNLKWSLGWVSAKINH